MLNSCIGFSSAPFYEHYAKCSRIEPDEFCSELRTHVYILYSFEIIGSFVLTIHGLLSIALLDHMKNIKLIRFVNKYTKFANVAYTILVICRVSMYIKVHSLV